MSSSRLKRLLLAACLLLWPAVASAIINIEEIHLGTPADGFSGQINGDVAGAAGNSDKLALATAGRGQWHGGDHTLFIVGEYAYGTSQGRQDTNRAFGHLRHRWQWRPLWASEAFVQASRDSFARLRFRGLVGGGLRLTLSEGQQHATAYVGLGAFFERERLRKLLGTNDPLASSLWRGNAYLTLKQRFNEQLRLLSTTFYQPAFAAFGDFRLLEEAALYVKVLDDVDIRLSLQISHDSQPPAGVKATDFIYASGIEFRF